MERDSISNEFECSPKGGHGARSYRVELWVCGWLARLEHKNRHHHRNLHGTIRKHNVATTTNRDPGFNFRRMVILCERSHLQLGQPPFLVPHKRRNNYVIIRECARSAAEILGDAIGRTEWPVWATGQWRGQSRMDCHHSNSCSIETSNYSTAHENTVVYDHLHL